MNGRRFCAAAHLALALTSGCGDEPQPPEAVVAPVKLYTVGSDGQSGRSVYPGEIVSADGAPDDVGLRIDVRIPVRDVAGGASELGASAATARWQPEVVVASMPDRVLPARVEEIGASADAETESLEATFSIEGPLDVRVNPGMTAQVRLTLEPNDDANGLHIPARAALADESGEPYVWRVEPSAMTVTRVPVELGELHQDRIAIITGLAEGDVIAVSGLQHLRDGMQVTPLEE